MVLQALVKTQVLDMEIYGGPYHDMDYVENSDRRLYDKGAVPIWHANPICDPILGGRIY